MNKIYSTLFAAMLTIAAGAQTLCSGAGRYATSVYTTYTVTSNITYGSNYPLTSTTTQSVLTLDFYEPSADTSQARPLIIWAHGGSFISGTKNDQDVSELSARFAKRGFACASINYRLGFSPFDSTGVIPALLRAVQDMKAAVRFFYKDKSTINKYKIDTNNIFIGGSSAGAITALHVAYLNKSCEINPYINQTTLTSYGGIEGGSGNQCYSSRVKGVINLCGALGKYWWLEAGDVPLCSMHGTTDGTVKYGQGIANPGVPIMYLDGSRMIAAGTAVSGVNHKFYTWYNAGHVPYAGTSTAQIAYMDTTERFVRDYLVSRLGCTNSPLMTPNTPYGAVTAYAYTPCTANVAMACDVGVKEIQTNSVLEEVYPNPSSESVNVVFKNSNTVHTVTLTDMTGKVIQTETTKEPLYVIRKNNMGQGIYFLKATNENGEYSVQKIIFY